MTYRDESGDITPSELKEVAGILQQKELDLRTEIRNIGPLRPHSTAFRRTLELETKATRVRELWEKLERG